ncbi:MAG TPA: PAS domain S-box protein [Flavisolibacter sp.]
MKESEERFYQLIRTLQTPVYTTNAAGIITCYNQAAAELWGREPVIGQDRWCGSVKAFTATGEPLALEDGPMARCLYESKPIHGQEVVIERTDGSLRTIIPNPTPLYDREGNLTGALNVVLDVTDQRQQEKALRNSELMHRQIIQSLQVAVYTTDPEGKIVLYNKAAVELFGRKPEPGDHFWRCFKVYTTEDAELAPDATPMGICLRERHAVHGRELKIFRSDGSTRCVIPHPQPLFDDDGNFTGAINTLVDITDEHAKEQALRESEARFRELTATLEKKIGEKAMDLQYKNEQLKRSEERYHKMVDEVEDYAIILLDKHGVVQNWNKGAEKIKGYSEKDIVGKSFSTFYLPQDRANGLPQKLLNEAARKGKAIHEGWRMRKNGSVFWGSIVLTALHNDNDEVIGFSKVTRDLTERKLAEDRLKEYTSQLEFQNKELEQFAYAASHDMKEPLRKIHLYNSFIYENCQHTLDEKSRDFMQRSINAVKRMTDLIEDLLTYSKATLHVENYEAVDLNEIMAEIQVMHHDEFEQKHVHLVIDPLPVIQAIPFQMKQLLYNLVSNAVKYRHPDRQAVIRVEPGMVKGSVIGEGEAEAGRTYHRISVIDNGIGFDPQYAEKIFNIFQRLNNQSLVKGSGIGLAICKRIVQNHHGFITATGTQDVGARFDIYIPEDL